MKKLFKVIALTVVLCLMLSVCAIAIDIPEPTNNFFVNDFANVISEEDEEEIMVIGASLYNQTTAQVVVVTVDSLDGYDVEEYGLELGREWGVGSAETNNGVVLLMSLSDRQVTIQVGYGLEGCLPDGKTGRILDNYAIPYLSQNDFSTGLTESYKAITSVVYEEYGVEPDVDYGYVDYSIEDTDAVEDWMGAVFIVMIIIFLVVFILNGPFGGVGTHRGGRYYGGYTGGSNGGFSSGGSSRGGGGFSGGGGFRGGGGSFGGGGSSRGF